jgi:hypothetical protein
MSVSNCYTLSSQVSIGKHQHRLGGLTDGRLSMDGSRGGEIHVGAAMQQSGESPPREVLEEEDGRTEVLRASLAGGVTEMGHRRRGANGSNGVHRCDILGVEKVSCGWDKLQRGTCEVSVPFIGPQREQSRQEGGSHQWLGGLLMARWFRALIWHRRGGETEGAVLGEEVEAARNLGGRRRRSARQQLAGWVMAARHLIGGGR